MEKLWSPWRSQYIESFQNKNNPKQCIFCNSLLTAGTDAKSLVVEVGELTFTILNLYPYNNGHLMVVPKRHTDSFSSLTDNENLEIIQKLQLAEKALLKVSNPDGFNIGANLGKVSGAGIADHIHFHIVPRWTGDTNFMPVIGEIKVLSQDLLDTKRKLMAAYIELKDSNQ